MTLDRAASGSYPPKLMLCCSWPSTKCLLRVNVWINPYTLHHRSLIASQSWISSSTINPNICYTNYLRRPKIAQIGVKKSQSNERSWIALSSQAIQMCPIRRTHCTGELHKTNGKCHTPLAVHQSFDMSEVKTPSGINLSFKKWGIQTWPKLG